MKILYFGAVWCPACLIMKPLMKKVGNTKFNFEIFYYDYDMDEDLVNKWQIGKVLPEMILVDENNCEIKRMVGEKTIKEVEEFINEFINKF